MAGDEYQDLFRAFMKFKNPGPNLYESDHLRRQTMPLEFMKANRDEFLRAGFLLFFCGVNFFHTGDFSAL